ncbi:MAG TPA: type III PLP-dependent enzyme [Azospirillaceae bacterium]|nr:type III PLP-dependent enzyme [Azospirillaceae bacterium]
MSPIKTRYRAAVAPLRREFVQRADGVAWPTVDQVVLRDRPSEPVHCLRPHIVTEAARAFRAAFPGDVMYAVKCNPEPGAIRALWAGGVRHYDVASLGEIRLVATMYPEARLSFMHPVKPRAAIREAYARFGVRTFALDHPVELAKIVEETGGGADLTLVVRIAVPKSGAAYDLSGKFGADFDTAVNLLRAARAVAARVGVTFHVGSQCLRPDAYAEAVRLAAGVSAAAGVPLDVLDVGGGFPVSYPDQIPPSLDVFMDAIRGAVAKAFPQGVELYAEPGRALVAGGTSVVVQVDLTKDDMLFVNDGVYGSLSDAGVPGFRFPVRLVRRSDAAPRAFGLFGPTCDSADKMKGPFWLPGDVREGDWIEIGQLGAYGGSLRTAFNGFDRARLVEVSDRPLMETPGYAQAADAA